MRNKNLFCGYKLLNITIMKKHLLLSLSLLLSAASMLAQSSTGYIPLVVEGARWEGEVEVQAWIPELQEHHPYTIKIQGDSIINGIQYKKCHYLFSEFNQEPNQYTIAVYLREDISERKVYAIYDSTYMPPSTQDGMETLMTDAYYPAFLMRCCYMISPTHQIPTCLIRIMKSPH